MGFPEETDKSTNNIRQTFVDFFINNCYFTEIQGSSLLDPSVPMTFVMSAGLAQVEAGAGRMKKNARHYALVQNCFRYFDMELVGKKPYHLSFFRMPGAFSFGTEDRKETVSRIWRLLTEIFSLPRENLWVTFFSGGKLGRHVIHQDSETRQAWQDMGLESNKIIPLNGDHNFWKQGAGIVGKEHAPKCGPLSEVFFDRGEDFACGPNCLPGCGCERFVEIMNNLFITYIINDSNERIFPLENPFTETVIGLERMAMVLQGASSVFGIDSIAPLVRHIDNFVNPPENMNPTHQRIIADHMRAILFLTADGAPPPGKGGRQRLMRKLIRGLLTSMKVLEIEDPEFFPSLMKTAIDIHNTDHPGLKKARYQILDYLKTERDRFESTIASGYRKMKKMASSKRNTGFQGKEIIRLEKEEGIPVPLIRRFCRNTHIPFKVDQYEAAFGEWKHSTTGKQ